MTPYQESKCECFWEYVVPFRRFWGIFTAVVLCGVGFDFTYHHYTTGVYIMVTSVIVFLLELTWAVTLFLHVCLRSEYSPVLRYWEAVLWFDGWKKSLLYAVFSIILFVRPHRLWLCTAAGGMLILLACLYMLASCRKSRYSSKDQLLPNRDESFDSRYDEIPDVLDDTMPVAGESLSENLTEQDAILEI